MNPTLSLPRTRFTCGIVRRWCALTATGAPRHVAHCAACQEYFSAISTLEQALRHDAPASAPVASLGFEQRILNAVRTAADERHVASQPRRPNRLPAWAGVAALVAIAFLVTWSSRRPSGRSPIDPRPTAADAALVVDAVENLSSQLVDSVIPTTAEYVAHNPLQREANSLYADARSAIGFLAMNFLPPSKENAPPRSG